MDYSNAKGEVYLVGLVTDRYCSHINPTFRHASESLVAFIQGRGHFLGMHDDPSMGYAAIDVTDPSVVVDLHAEDFVDRLPLPGIHKDIHRAQDVTIHHDILSESEKLILAA